MSNINKQKVYFYQNNPCTIVNEINEDFVEISINHKYGAEMELMCMGCAVGDSDNKLSCTCSEHEWIVEQVQDEDHLCLVIARRIYLRENPVEHHDIEKLQKQIQEEKDRLEKTKVIHEEWRKSLSAKQSIIECLKQEEKYLSLQIESFEKERDRCEEGIRSMKDIYDEIEVYISDYHINKYTRKISTKEYDELLKRDELLRALEAGGVDNWEWYDESIKNASSIK